MQLHTRVTSTRKIVSVQQAHPGLCFLQGHHSLHFTNNCSGNGRCYCQLLQQGNETSQNRPGTFCTAKDFIKEKGSSYHSRLFMTVTESYSSPNLPCSCIIFKSQIIEPTIPFHFLHSVDLKMVSYSVQNSELPLMNQYPHFNIFPLHSLLIHSDSSFKKEEQVTLQR